MKQCIKYRIFPSKEQDSLLRELGFYATKLYNTDNHIRREIWEQKGEIPSWYDQRNMFVKNNNHWYRLLPSQTAQAVCKNLGDNYKSWFALRKTDTKANPPMYRKKTKLSPLTFSQHFRIENETIRFSMSRKFKKETGIGYLQFKLNKWKPILAGSVPKMATILYHKEKWMVHVTYEVPEPKPSRCKNIMSIDLGIINLATTVDMKGNCTIYKGGQALAVQHYFNKEIAKVKSKTEVQHSKKWSKALGRMNDKKIRQINQIIHTVSKSIIEEAKRNGVGTIIVGDIKNIRKGKKWNKKSGQKLHSWAFSKLTLQIEYKAILSGIRFEKVNESYTSQTCSCCGVIKKSNRKNRGLYVCNKCGNKVNADVNGSVNILQKYLRESNISRSIGSVVEPLIWRCNNVIPT
ncbi:transposase [candidate division WOR-3 bacterium]|nr:transposase [candidate division WOR-3 bacterium]